MTGFWFMGDDDVPVPGVDEEVVEILTETFTVCSTLTLLLTLLLVLAVKDVKIV